MKKTRRTSQVGEQLRAEISKVITQELRDPDVGWATILEVETSTDFSFARVFVSILGSEEQQEKGIKALQKSSTRIRHLVSQRLRNLRTTPALEFKLDRTAERAARIEGILREVVPPEAPKDEEDDAEQEHDGNEREE